MYDSRIKYIIIIIIIIIISNVFQQILRMFSKFAYYAFTHLTRFPTITGDASVTQEKRFLPHSASFENVFQIRVQLMRHTFLCYPCDA